MKINFPCARLSCISALLLLFCIHDVTTETIISSPRVSDWGAWGKWENCPKNTFVTGMQLYSQPARGAWLDDRGLTGIRLFCNYYEGSKATSHAISSSTDNVGTWGQKYFCDRFMTGFQLRSEQYRGMFVDDTAGNNLRMFCDGKSHLFQEGDGTSFGKWTDKRLCGANEAVCGIITQIDIQSSWDRTGLNNVLMKCCPLPHPLTKCIPTTDFEIVALCENNGEQAQALKKCSYSRHIGVSYTDVHKDTRILFEKSGLGLEQMMTKFQAKFMNISVKPKSKSLLMREDSVESYWQYSPSYIWQPQVSITSKVTATKGTSVRMYQIHGKCGILQVWGTKLKRMAENKETNKMTVKYIDFTNDEGDIDYVLG